MVTKEEIKRISHSDPETIEAFLTALVAQFNAKVEQLESRIKELERQLGQNSQNSNWPPSHDLKRKPANHRKPGGKKGGPVGHKGNTLSCSADPDEIITHTIASCQDCMASFADVDVSRYEKRQVFDIPPPVMVVTEHRVECKRCPCCHKLQKAVFPEGVNARAQYGQRFIAMAAYLHTYQLLPLARTTDLLYVLTGCQPSEATLLAGIHKMADALHPYETVIRQRLLDSPVIHADETGVHVDKKEHWVHVASTAEWTLLSVHPSRGSEGMKAMGVLPFFKGTVCHDFYWPYFKKDQDFNFGHTLCHAHLSRECKGIADYDGHRWARAMGTLLHQSWAATRRARKAGKALDSALIGTYERRYDKILELGKTEWEKEIVPKQIGVRGRQGKSKAANLWTRFYDYKDNILGYLRDADLPFDNNQAERDLRMVAVKRKISGCFRSDSTPAFFATIRSFISTLIKQERPILASLVSAYQGTFSFHPQSAE